MKFEKITDKKIKIILSSKDMKENCISRENILSNSNNFQKLLEYLIEKAEQELCFHTDDSQLLIEAIASSGEECICTVTKFSDNKKCQNSHFDLFIYKFNNFDDLLNLCTFLKNFSCLNLKDFSRNFSLIFYNGTYYLQALDTIKFHVLLDYLKMFFSEFGKDVSTHVGIEGILSEYGKVIFAKNAILKSINSFK